jgi:hypothetical protein
MRRQKAHSRWTDRLVGLTDDHNVRGRNLDAVMGHINRKTSSLRYQKDIPVSLRVGGSYFTLAEPSHYRTVFCLVAGTVISGARQYAVHSKSWKGSRVPTKFTPTRQVNWDVQWEVNRIQSKNSRKSSIKSVAKNRIWIRCILPWSAGGDPYIDLPTKYAKKYSYFHFILSFHYLLTDHRIRFPRLGAWCEDKLDWKRSRETLSRKFNPSYFKWKWEEQGIRHSFDVGIYSGPNEFLAAGEEAE